VENSTARVRLPNGSYQVRFVRPADGQIIATMEHTSAGLHAAAPIKLPQFTDDLAVIVTIAQGQE
jgi:hypothetical protein